MAFDRTDPIRVGSTLYGEKRRQALDHLASLSAEVRDLDRQLTALSRRRRHVAAAARTHRRILWPNFAKRGRQPAPDGTERLPPAPHGAVVLWGRRLRAACRALLGAAGEHLELPELHALLHAQGYLIRSDHPVKALSDAMAYEVEQGRIRRVSRGTYQLLAA